MGFAPLIWQGRWHFVYFLYDVTNVFLFTFCCNDCVGGDCTRLSSQIILVSFWILQMLQVVTHVFFFYNWHPNTYWVTETAFRRRTRAKPGLTTREHQQQIHGKPHIHHHHLHHSPPLMETGHLNRTYHPLTECYFQKDLSSAHLCSRALLTVRMDSTLMMWLPSPITCLQLNPASELLV